MKTITQLSLAAICLVAAIIIATAPPLFKTASQHKETKPPPCSPNCVVEQKTEKPAPKPPPTKPGRSPAQFAEIPTEHSG